MHRSRTFGPSGLVALYWLIPAIHQPLSRGPRDSIGSNLRKSQTGRVVSLSQAQDPGSRLQLISISDWIES